MRKLIMWNLITLDGFFEGDHPWNLKFHQAAWGPELEAFSIEQLKTADMLFFGRVTYEGMAAHFQTDEGEVADFMNRLPKVVFSRKLDRADWNNTALIKDDLAGNVKRLKQAGNGNIFVFGSADLSASLMKEGLFDEYRIAIAPIMIGRGTALFGRDLPQTNFKLLESRTLSNGCAILRYEPNVP
ncbi:MAG TPA: dihydrofolate reductase family protein [Candidatus Koribacter sp.]|jgi:dihydrofolate reductase